MKSKVLFYSILLISFMFLFSCDNSNSSSSSSQSYAEPAPKTRMDGAAYFYNNYDEFRINLGGDYGSHRIKSVSLEGNYMKVKYAYKNGVLRGKIEPNGSFSGTYSTSSTSGDFDMRFRTDGSASGSWNSTGGFLNFSGSMAFEN